MKGDISLPSKFLTLSPSLLLSHPPPFIPPPKPKPIPQEATFEEAIALTGQGTKCQWIIVIACGLCVWCGICESVGVAYLIPSARCDLRLTPTEKTFLGSITAIGMMIACWPCGLAADTWGRRPVILACLFTDAVLGMLCSVIPSSTILLVFRFFGGVCVSGPSAISYAFLSEYHGEQSRSRAVVSAGLFVAGAVIALPATAWAVLPVEIDFMLPWGVNLSSWRIFIILMALPSLLTALIILFLDESPRFQLSQGKEKEALKTLAALFSSNTGIPQSEYPVKRLQLEASGEQPINRDQGHLVQVLKSLWSKTRPLFQSPHLKPLALCCTLQAAVYVCANGLLMWLPDIFGRIASSDLSSAPLCDALALSDLSNFIADKEEQICSASSVDTSAFINALIIGGTVGAAYVVSAVFSGMINKRIFFGFLMLIASGIGFGVAPASPSSVTLALTSIFHACAGVSITLLGGLTADLFPTHLRAASLSISLTCGRFGMFGGSSVIGALLEINCESAFHLAAGVALGAALLSLLLPKKSSPDSVV